MDQNLQRNRLSVTLQVPKHGWQDRAYLARCPGGAFCTSRRTLASYASKREKQCAVQIQNIRGSKSFFELEKFIPNRVHVNVNAQMGPIHNFLSGVIPAWKRIFRIGATRALTFSVEWLISKIGFPKTGFPKTGCPKTGLPRTGRILADFGRKNRFGKTDLGKERFSPNWFWIKIGLEKPIRKKTDLENLSWQTPMTEPQDTSLSATIIQHGAWNMFRDKCSDNRTVGRSDGRMVGWSMDQTDNWQTG